MIGIIKYLLILLLVCAPFQADAGDIMLRHEVTLDRPIIRLSDIFSGIDISEDAEIALSPAPGRSVTYNANVLEPLALRYSLGWTPASYSEKIVISRAAVYITSDMVRSLIMKKINLTSAAKQNIKIRFDGRAPGLTLAAGDALEYDVNAFEYNSDSRRFRGKLVAQCGNGPKTQFISGHVVVTKTIPVLSRRLSAGTIISQDDLRWEDVDDMRVSEDVLVEAEQIVGQELRRTQGEGARFLSRDVMVPRMVKRGDLVTLRMVTPYMEITTKGKALEDGVYGALVRVKNTRSKKIVEGTVIQDGIIRVDANQKMASVN